MTRREVILLCAFIAATAVAAITLYTKQSQHRSVARASGFASPGRFQLVEAGPHVLRMDTVTGQTWLWDSYTEEFCDVTPTASKPLIGTRQE